MNYLEEVGNLQHVLVAVCVFLCVYIFAFTKKRKYNLLPGPRGLPIFGNLPFLGHNPHVVLSKLGKKYGGIFSVYLGRTYHVVITDVTIVKQLLGKMSTADRPPGLFQLMPNGVGFAELNGLEWVEQRRYTVMEMKNLGFGKSRWEELVQMEVSDILDFLTQSGGEPTDVNSVLSASISNNVLSLVSNHRLPKGHPRRDIIDHGVESFETIYNPSSLIVHYPKLFKIAVNLGLLTVGQMLKDMINMNKCIRKEVAEIEQEKGGNSYIDKYLNEIEKNKRLNLGNSFNESNLLGNVQALIIAGSDTTFVSLLWLLLAMASYQEVQQKLHEELDAVLGKDGSVDWVNRQKLPYCMATIMEGQRWRTVVPLNLLHRTNEDIVINGYDIPKGTNIITGIWAIHNDTTYWRNPDAFEPERFLTEDGNTVKEPEAYLPFSYGKRVCIGKTVALIELFHYFVSITQRFHVLPASDNSMPDLEGFPGLTFQPKRQQLRFVPR